MNDATEGEEPQFDEIYTKEDFTEWLQYLIDQESKKDYYEGFEKPTAQRYGLPNLNYLVSPMRFTMRKVKFESNSDKNSMAFVKNSW